jgi:hypothetical protein
VCVWVFVSKKHTTGPGGLLQTHCLIPEVVKGTIMSFELLLEGYAQFPGPNVAMQFPAVREGRYVLVKENK